MNIVIGGAPEFSNGELAHKEIEAILKQLKIKPKNIKIVYGVGQADKAKAGEGGFFFAQQWAENNDIIFRSGEPKWKEHGKNAVQKRNQILAENCDVLIVMTKGSSTGGNSIIEFFEQEGVPVHKIAQKEIIKDAKEARTIYSLVAKNLLDTSVTLDVETTGLSELEDDIVEIAVVNAKTGKALFNSFIYTDRPINPHAALVNGITPEMLEGQPTLEKAWTKLQAKLEGKVIIASNSDFDERMLCYGLVRRNVTPPNNLWTCLQKLYCKYSGQKAAKIKTEKMARQLGIEPGTHRALTDAQAQAQILKAMAKGVVPDLEVE